MSISESNKRVAKNTSLLYLRMMVVMCVQLYTSRIVLSTLGIEDFGIYGVVGGVVVMFSSLVGSLGSATSRFFTVELGKGNLEQLKKVFSSAVMLHALMAVVIVVLCETVGVWFLETKMEIPESRMTAAHFLLQFSIITTFFTMIQVPYTGAVIAHERMDVFAYIGLGEVLLKLAIVYLLQYSPFDKLVWYGFLLMLLQLVHVFLYWVYCRLHFIETRFHIQKDKRLFLNMLAYSTYDFIGSMSVMAQGQGLNMVLNVFCGPVVNAARAIAFQVQGAASQFSGNFMTAVRPQIIKLYAQGKIDEAMLLVHRSSILAYVLMLVVVIPLSYNIDFILGLWLGTYPDYTASFTIIILVVSLLNSFRSPRITMFHATGNIKLSNIVTGGILCMALPLGYVLMKMNFSPNSVFYGMLATTIMADCTNLIILRRYIVYSIPKFLKEVHLKCLLITIITLLLTYLSCSLSISGWGCLALSTVVSTLSIALCVWYVVLTPSLRLNVVLLVRNRLLRDNVK